MKKLIYAVIGFILSFNAYAKDDFTYIASKISNKKLFTQVKGEKENGHIASWWIDRNSITGTKSNKLYSMFFIYTEDNYSTIVLTVTKYNIDCQNQSQAELNLTTKLYINNELVETEVKKIDDKIFEDILSQSSAWNAYRVVCQGMKVIK
jgi:hypothetical protein